MMYVNFPHDVCKHFCTYLKVYILKLILFGLSFLMYGRLK